MAYGNLAVDTITTSTGQIIGASSSATMKNRIINGDMRIDQRYAGSATANSINSYTVDRWEVWQTTTGKLVAQQVTDAPTGFINSLKVTSQSAYSMSTGELFRILQFIEGYNVADFAYGTASAVTVTLSFWAKSSLTGTFGGAYGRNDGLRTYPFVYTINQANTWEYKTIVIPGDTSGTYVKDNTAAIALQFCLGIGTAAIGGTAFTWGTSAVGASVVGTSVVGTSGATYQITGVQLEVGSTATTFDYRHYGQELQLCQRYYQSLGNVGLSSYNASGVIGFVFPTAMRATPTITWSYNGTSNAIYRFADAVVSTLSSPTVIATNTGMQTMYAFSPASWAGASGYGYQAAFVLNAEL